MQRQVTVSMDDHDDILKGRLTTLNARYRSKTRSKFRSGSGQILDLDSRYLYKI